MPTILCYLSNATKPFISLIISWICLTLFGRSKMKPLEDIGNSNFRNSRLLHGKNEMVEKRSTDILVPVIGLFNNNRLHIPQTTKAFQFQGGQRNCWKSERIGSHHISCIPTGNNHLTFINGEWFILNSFIGRSKVPGLEQYVGHIFKKRLTNGSSLTNIFLWFEDNNRRDHFSSVLSLVLMEITKHRY